MIPLLVPGFLFEKGNVNNVKHMSFQCSNHIFVYKLRYKFDYFCPPFLISCYNFCWQLLVHVYHLWFGRCRAEQKELVRALTNTKTDDINFLRERLSILNWNLFFIPIPYHRTDPCKASSFKQQWNSLPTDLCNTDSLYNQTQNSSVQTL